MSSMAVKRRPFKVYLFLEIGKRHTEPCLANMEAGASLVTPEQLPFATVFVQNSTILEQIMLPRVSYPKHLKKFHGRSLSIC